LLDFKTSFYSYPRCCRRSSSRSKSNSNECSQQFWTRKSGGGGGGEKQEEQGRGGVVEGDEIAARSLSVCLAWRGELLTGEVFPCDLHAYCAATTLTSGDEAWLLLLPGRG
jgi:hypothetical protein